MNNNNKKANNKRVNQITLQKRGPKLMLKLNRDIVVPVSRNLNLHQDNPKLKNL